MDQVFEFIGNHLALAGAFAVLLVALLVTENKRGGQSVSTQQATQLVNREQAVIVDLRAQSEFNAGHIVDALNIPYTSLSSHLGDLEKYKEKPVILVCKMGQHSSAAGKVLMKAGFTQVKRMSGGMAEWGNANLPVVKS